MQLWFRKPLREHTCQITLALVKKKINIPQGFLGASLFNQGHYVLNPSLLGHVWGVGFFFNLCSSVSCTQNAKHWWYCMFPADKGLYSSLTLLARAGRLPWEQFKHFRGPAQIPRNPAGSLRNRAAECWELEPFPCCCRVNL